MNGMKWIFPVNKMVVYKNEYSAESNASKSLTWLAKKSREEDQPKCRLEVCRTMCPYRESGFVADVVGLNEEKDAVTLARTDGGRAGGDWKACIVMYLNRKCVPEEFEGREMEFVKEHTPRLMESCPIKMEHEMYEWNR